MLEQSNSRKNALGQSLKLSRLKAKNLAEVSDEILKQICGGRIPDGDALAVILATANTDLSREITRNELNDGTTRINAAVIEEGTTNATINQSIK